MTPKEWGIGFTEGVAIKLGKYVLLWLIIVGILLIVVSLFGIGVDDTDVSAWDRSGMKVHIDALTGMQYLSDGKGGITVRLDANGNPMLPSRIGDHK